MTEPRIVAERYRIDGTIGVGSQGRTFLAHDLETDEPVALKRLSLADALDWKAIELFEREGQALESLDHPQIPRYIDAFHEDTDTREFYLVQSFVKGDNLDVLVRDGERWDTDSLVDFLDQMLGILSYLGRRRPPVVHRDIKPTNIIRDDDGKYHLIDFGAVQTVVSSASGASTVIGTGGFVPVEQLMGRATSKSDLYSLGATAAYLASGVHPSDMESAALRLQFRRYVQLDSFVAGFIERLLEPKPADRFSSAGAAQKELRSRSEQTALVRALPYSTDNGLVDFAYEDTTLAVHVRNRPGFVLSSNFGAAFGATGLALLILGIVIEGLITMAIGLPCLLIGFLLIAINLTRNRRREVRVGEGKLHFQSKLLGFVTEEQEISVRDLVEIGADGDSVYIVSGLSSLELPDLDSDERKEVVDQLRVHTGVSNG